MRNQKKTPRKQIEKFSAIFTQLGLVLVLFVVYSFLEYQTEKTIAKAVEPTVESGEVYLLEDKLIIYQKEIKKPVNVIPKQKPIVKVLSSFEKATEPTVETVFKTPTDNPIDTQIIDPDDIVEVDIPEEDVPETVPYYAVQNAPVFKGCEGLSEEENRKCLDKKLKKLIQRYFDADIANELGLRSGRHRINTEFVIDTSGEVTSVRIKAPHSRLEKETQRIISKIPKFTPGKQQNKAVKVKYVLPITFKVD